MTAKKINPKNMTSTLRALALVAIVALFSGSLFAQTMAVKTADGGSVSGDKSTPVVSAPTPRSIDGGGDVPASALPRVVKFSGSVPVAPGTDPTGTTVQVTFGLYADADGGSPLWMETHAVTLDSQGRYSVLLGSTNSNGMPTDLFSTDTARWLSIKVDGQNESSRSLLVSVPYALKAVEADKLAGKMASDFVSQDQLSAAVKKAVIDQVNTQSAKISANSGPTNTNANFVANTATDVVYVEQDGTGFAINAQSVSNIAVLGHAIATTGNFAAVQGVSDADNGKGVAGIATSLANGTNSSIGVYGQSASSTGYAVLGVATNGSGTPIGTAGRTTAPLGVAVRGEVTQSSALVFQGMAGTVPVVTIDGDRKS